MKKIFTKAMLVAAAAMASFACQKPEAIAPEEVTVDGLNFSAEKPEFADASKTEWKDSDIYWSKGDAIRVAYTCDGVWQNANGTATASEENGKKTAKLYASTQLSDASATAKFAVPGDFKGTAEGIYEFYAIYPSGAAVKKADFPFAPSVTVDIPVEQTPLANSFDSAADLMAAKSVDTFEGLPEEEISLLWTRIVAHGHLTLKNLQVEDDEKLQAITLTADEDADMVGQHYLYLDTYNVDKADGNNAANSLTVKADNLTVDAESGNVTFWTCFLPCTWKSLDVVAETDKAIYTRSIDLTDNEKTFAQNARNTLSINMSSAVREVKSSNALPFVKDFSDKTVTSGITELDGFTVSGSVYNAVGAIRLAKADAGGSITTQSLDLSCDFHVKVTASGWDSDELSLIVSSGDQSETVTLSAVGNGNSGPGECAEHIINFQPVSNSSSVTFAAAEGKRCYIKKIEIIEGHAVAVPVLKATAPNEIAAAGGEGTFNFTLANPQDGQSVSAKSNVDWITGESVSGNTVTYTVAENTSEEPREGTITLSYEGAQDVNVVITQAGKPAEGGEAEVKVWSWAGGGKTAFGNDSNVYKTYGLGSDYADSNAPYLIKLDGTGDYFIVQVDGAIQSVSIDVKMLGGATTSYLDVQGSADGTTFTSVQKFTISGSQYTVLKLATTESFDSSYRYIKFYFTKGSNVGVGPMSITYMSGNNTGGGTTEPDPEQPGEGGGETPDSGPKSYTLTIDAASFNSTSYAANNNEKTSIATATDGSSLSVKWTSNQVMLGTGANAGKMQWQKNAGYIYNSTDLGTITDVTITSSAGTFTKYVNSSQKPTTNGSGGYFNIKIGSATGYSTKVTITFTK